MANPYEKFGMIGDQNNGGAQTPSAPSASSAADNPYAKFGMVGDDSAQAGGGGASSSSEPPATIGSVGKQAGYGLLTGLPKMPGGIIDTVNALNPLSPSGLPARAGEYLKKKAEDWTGLKAPDVSIPDIATPSEMAGKAFDTAAGAIDSLTPQPQNPAERVGRAIGEGAITMAVPGLGEEGLAAKAAGALKGAFVGGTSGLGSQAAAEAVPEPYKPYAALAGGLAGGLTGEGIAAIPAAGRALWKFGSDYLAPMTEAGKQRMADDMLYKNTTDPNAAISAIDNNQRNLVERSNPTAYQLSGDEGIGQLERSTETQNPAPFIARRAEQRAAQIDALNNQQAEGHPDAVATVVSDNLRDLEQRQNALEDQARTHAQAQASGLGSADETTAEQARTATQNGLDDIKAQKDAIFKAVDPEGNVQTVTSPIKRAVSSIYGNLNPEMSLNLAPIETQIAGVINGYGKTLPLQRLIDLGSAVSKAMRDVVAPLTEPNNYAKARLTQLRGSIEDAINDSVAQKAATEQQSVATGAMQPSETLWQRLQRESQEFVRAKRERDAASARGNAGPDSVFGSTFGGGPEVPPSEMGAGNAASGQPSGSTGSSPPQGRLIDAETAGRLKGALAASADYKQTKNATPVAQILKRPGPTYPYTMPSGGVRSAIWKAGNEGGDRIRAVMKAAGNSSDAVESVKNMAAQSLRDKSPNGVINQKVLDAWTQRHGPALDALEEVAPGTKANFQSAARAGEYLGNVAANNKAAIDSYQKGIIGNLLKVKNSEDVVKTVGSIFGKNDAVAQMKALAAKVANNPEGMQGLRKAIVEYVQKNFISTTESGIKSDGFQKFLGKNRAALGQVFSDEELDGPGGWRSIAQDIKRGNKSITGSKLPGRSNTAQDTAAIASKTAKESLLGKIMDYAAGALAGTGVGHVVGGIFGGGIGTLAGAVGGKLISDMRQAGFKDVNDMVQQILLNPDMAKASLMRAAKRANTGSELTFGAAIRNSAVRSGAQAAYNSQKQH